VPRHLFVSPELHGLAYEDRPLPTGHGQTISQPYIVALMTEQLHLNGDEIVLEVGTGSGYQAAVLALLAGEVHTVEYHPDLAARARENVLRLGVSNVFFHVGDGSEGLPEYAPYDGILVTAAAPITPRSLLDQLAEKGRLVIPIGSRTEQDLVCWIKTLDGFHKRMVAPVAFVPLRGRYGWRDDEWM
jgi:protein-L-isoaspartate(D-aspartate) O-methyltransferase